MLVTSSGNMLIIETWICKYCNWDIVECNLSLRYTTVVGKYPETIHFLVGFEPATFGKEYCCISSAV